jgi:hypothetical protein
VKRACTIPPASPLPTLSHNSGPLVGLIVERHRMVLVASAGEAAQSAAAAIQLAVLMASAIAAPG